MTAGALTLVAFDDRRGSNEVTYFYEVRNFGDADATDVVITDDKIGEIDVISLLPAGESRTRMKSVNLDTTTTNIATAVGRTLGSGVECSDNSDEVTVTVVPSQSGGSKSRR